MCVCVCVCYLYVRVKILLWLNLCEIRMVTLLLLCLYINYFFYKHSHSISYVYSIFALVGFFFYHLVNSVPLNPYFMATYLLSFKPHEPKLQQINYYYYFKKLKYIFLTMR